MSAGSLRTDGDSNVTEIVQTYPTYLKTAAQRFLDKGAAGIILASQLPTNVWEKGNFTYKSTVFDDYDV